MRESFERWAGARYLPLSVIKWSMPLRMRLSLWTSFPLNQRYGVMGSLIVNVYTANMKNTNSNESNKINTQETNTGRHADHASKERGRAGGGGGLRRGELGVSKVEAQKSSTGTGGESISANNGRTLKDTWTARQGTNFANQVPKPHKTSVKRHALMRGYPRLPPSPPNL